MPKYKLVYFDSDGGRGEPVRIALHAAGIVFGDNRLSFEEFAKTRKDTRFNSVPTLEIDGVQITQSNAMSRYVGKMAGLYPDDNMQALYCDEVMDGIEDLLHHITHTFGLEGDELRLAREKLVDGWLAIYLRGLSELLARGGEYCADNRLTVADLKLWVLTRWLKSGMLDHIPADIVQRLAPNLLEHQKRITSDPVVTAYYASRG